MSVKRGLENLNAITLNQAKSLGYGKTVYAINFFNADKTHMRFKVNGKPQTWKRSPEKIKVPLKRGLYEFMYLTEKNLAEFSMEEV